MERHVKSEVLVISYCLLPLLYGNISKKVSQVIINEGSTMQQGLGLGLATPSWGGGVLKKVLYGNIGLIPECRFSYLSYT